MKRQPETQLQHGLAIGVMASDGTPCHAPDGTILNWSWDEQAVMTALGETDPVRFFCQVIEANLYALGYIGLCVYAAPEGYDADGSWWVQPHTAYPDCPYLNWRDDAIEQTGDVSITSAGVLLLAARYQKEG